MTEQAVRTDEIMDINRRSLSELGAPQRPRIVLIGVAHVFDIRDKVREIIMRESPKTVALELDSARLEALLSREELPGNEPFLYQLLARFQKNLAKEFGSEVGSEMIAAAGAAKEVGARIALIDMDAANLFSTLRRAMSIREKVMLLVGVFLAFFTKRSTVEKEMARYSKDEVGFFHEIQRSYPTIMKILIEDRNRFMAQRLREISAEASPIVAVVGDGHITGMEALLSEFADLEIWRLEDLRRDRMSESNKELTMSFTLRSSDSKV